MSIMFNQRNRSSGLSVFSSNLGVPRKFPSISPEMFGSRIDRRGIITPTMVSPRFGTDEDNVQTHLTNKNYQQDQQEAEHVLSSSHDSIHNRIRNTLDTLSQTNLPASMASFYQQDRRFFQMLETGKMVDMPTAKSIVPLNNGKLIGSSTGILGLPSKPQQYTTDFPMSSGAVSTSADTTADDLCSSGSGLSPSGERVSKDDGKESISRGLEDCDSHGTSIEEEKMDKNVLLELRAIRSMMSTLMRVTTSQHEEVDEKGNEVITEDDAIEGANREDEHGVSIAWWNESETISKEERNEDGKGHEVMVKRGPQLPPKREKKLVDEETEMTSTISQNEEEKSEEEEKREEEEKSRIEDEGGEKGETEVNRRERRRISYGMDKRECRREEQVPRQKRTIPLGRVKTMMDLPFISLNGQRFRLEPMENDREKSKTSTSDQCDSDRIRYGGKTDYEKKCESWESEKEKERREKYLRRKKRSTNQWDEINEEELNRLKLQRDLLIEDVTIIKTQRNELQGQLDEQEKHLNSTHNALDK